jgi:CubicO group peptidase (beta-lactamase class C family)
MVVLPGCALRRRVRVDGGFGSSWLVDPAHDLIVIVLTQRQFETPDLPRVHRDIQAAAYTALG